MAKILFLFANLRGESELERGESVEQENHTERDRQTNREFYNFMTNTQYSKLLRLCLLLC